MFSIVFCKKFKVLYCFIKLTGAYSLAFIHLTIETNVCKFWEELTASMAKPRILNTSIKN